MLDHSLNNNYSQGGKVIGKNLRNVINEDLEYITPLPNSYGLGNRNLLSTSSTINRYEEVGSVNKSSLSNKLERINAVDNYPSIPNTFTIDDGAMNLLKDNIKHPDNTCTEVVEDRNLGNGEYVKSITNNSTVEGEDVDKGGFDDLVPNNSEDRFTDKIIEHIEGPKNHNNKLSNLLELLNKEERLSNESAERFKRKLNGSDFTKLDHNECNIIEGQERLFNHFKEGLDKGGSSKSTLNKDSLGDAEGLESIHKSIEAGLPVNRGLPKNPTLNEGTLLNEGTFVERAEQYKHVADDISESISAVHTTPTPDNTLQS